MFERVEQEDLHRHKCRNLKPAGVEGIEPSLAVLETAVLPLNDTPKHQKILPDDC